MDSIHSFREQYGDVYVTETADGLIIPWKPLTIGDYFEYENKFSLGEIAPSVLEDEIFKKCVTLDVLANNLDLLKAGTVTTVVATIMQHSGPATREEIQQVLEFSRQRSQQIIHKMVTTICQAFPSYKPDDLYLLDFATFMLRLAQAEDKLMTAGILTQPLSMIAPEEVEQVPVASKKPKVDLGKLAEEFAKQHPEQLKEPTQQFRAALKTTPPSGKTVISKMDIAEHQLAAGEQANQEKDTVEGAHKVFGDYLKQDKVEIKSHEERVAEAKRRKEENDRRYAIYEQKYKAQKDRAEANAKRILEERANRKKRK